MITEDRTRLYALVGIAGIAILAVGGIVWAIIAGPTPERPSGPEQDLAFIDDNDPAIGPGESKAIVRIFGDFQCPACRAAEVGLQYAIKTYGDRVRFIWNDFPLVTVHPNARGAANAARCAEEQGKFWQFHDALYSHQDDWASLAKPLDVWKKYVTDVGMKMDTFEACIAANRYARKVEDDMAEGVTNRLRVTPTFFINNIRKEGALSQADWDSLLQAALSGS